MCHSQSRQLILYGRCEQRCGNKWSKGFAENKELPGKCQRDQDKLIIISFMLDMILLLEIYVNRQTN